MIRLVSGWAEACAIADLPIESIPRDGQVRRQLTDLCNRHEHGEFDEATMFDRGAALTGLPRDKFAAAFLGWIKDPYPGVAEVVQRVKRSGLTTACLSNTTDAHWRLMNHDPRHKLPLHELHHRFTSFQIGAMKPHPRIYEHVEKSTGAPPGSILFFDDYPANVQAARDRGWHAHRIDPTGDPAQQMLEELSRRGLV